MTDPASPTDHQTLMARETREAPATVARLLQRNRRACEQLSERLRQRPPQLVVTCARGSSDHAATFAKYLIETRLGLTTASAAPSVSSVYGRRQLLSEALFLAISQSGQSPDLVAHAQAARESGALVVALVNQTASPLAATSHVCLPLHAGPERSVAATKSYVAALAALLQLVAHWAEEPGLRDALPRLPDQLEASQALDWSAAREPLAGARDLLVVGRGLGFGIAQEAALKFKETARIHAEAFSAAEIMHGPLALIRAGYPVLVFSQEDQTRAGVRELVATLRDKGARVFVAAAGEPAPGRLPVLAGLHPACAPLAMVQSFYGLVNAVALARGLDPDLPPHLRKVTETQ